MSHSPLHTQLLRTIATAASDQHGARPTRRAFLRASASAALPLALRSAPPAPTMNVAVVGAGLAGLSCAYELKKAGVRAVIYEASGRAGGRCRSLSGYFPGQTVERGGELIDNLHKTMLGYAKEFRLTLEDVGKTTGEVFYHFDGQRVPETKVVEEYRAFVPAMRADLRRLSPEPTADSHGAADVELDRMSLKQYLETRRAGHLVLKAIEQAYIAEFGRSVEEQSCLNFLLFIHADRRSRFQPFGVFSDERYHIVEGNEEIARGLADRVAGQVVFGKSLAAVAPSSTGGVRLTFFDGTFANHDAVVLTCPFSVLRHVDLQALELPLWKTTAISQLGYGDNAKMMIGFTKPVWRALGSNGSSYSDLPNHQATWESSPSTATDTRAVLTDYSGGKRGIQLDPHPSKLQGQASLFLADLDRVMPGAYSYARRTPAGFHAHLEHWPSNPLTRGSYSCYRPGQFTSIAGNEGKPVGNVFFAGEHTNSFYEWQGFMEGALLSGVQAAKDLLRKKR